MKTKVIHIITLLELGGAQQNTLYTLSHLNSDKYEPILLCGQGGFLDEQARQAPHKTIFLNTLVRPIHPLKDLMALARIYWILKKQKPAIVHTHSTKAGIIGRWAAWLARVPKIIHTYHGFAFYQGQNKILKNLYILAEKITGPLADSLIAVSQENLNQALRLSFGLPPKFKLIRSGVSLKKYREENTAPRQTQASNSKEETVTTIGPFKPQKNLPDFIRMAALVHKKHPDARFLIVGDGPLRAQLETQTKELNLQGIVQMPGWQEDIPGILARTDIFVMTSLWEGLPRSLVEAMASGLPCVVNAIDGTKDIVQDGINGFLIPPHHPERTADRVIALLDNPQKAVRLGQKARDSIGKEFDIDHMVHQQENLYQKLLS